MIAMSYKPLFGPPVKYGSKIYWVKGAPNNGRGWYLFKIPFIRKFVVKNETGNIIICNLVEDIEESIRHKQNLVDKYPAWGGDHIMVWNKMELLLNKEFLNA